MTLNRRDVWITPVFSRDEGRSWYCEVWDRQTGKTLHLTELRPTKEEAIAEAEAWRLRATTPKPSPPPLLRPYSR